VRAHVCGDAGKKKSCLVSNRTKEILIFLMGEKRNRQEK